MNQNYSRSGCISTAFFRSKTECKLLSLLQPAMSWSTWQTSESSTTWPKDNQESSTTWPKDKWDAKSSWWQSSDWSPPTSTTPTPSLPTSFVSDHQHYDKTPLGKGGHVLHKQVQPTEWSRKSGLAGRDVTDIRAYGLSHRGLGDFSFRLLSEGRHQSIVWARSGSESVLLTALLKKIRESEFPSTKLPKFVTKRHHQTNTKKQ